MKKDNQQSQIILYQTEDGKIRVEVRFEHENVWLTQKLMAELFDTTVANINIHLKNIFQGGELQQNLVIKEFLITASDGKKYKTKMYGLEVIIAVGYRVNSARGTLFRQWATDRLKEYMVKGFTMDDARLKQGGYRSRYFEELLERIRDIRSSERMLYQKVTDIYATSIDYRKDAEETELFFKTVQNKMHFAVSGKTAAEIITQRADSKKPLMGLTNFSGLHPIQRDIYIAKNYLNERELEMLNRIVDAYLSFAEIQAKSEHAMSMKNWISKLDEYLKILGKGILKNAGSISAQDAENKAFGEYEKFRIEQDKNYISDFDREIKKLIESKKRKK
ncbi:MAG: cell filamentation protein Fic [Candidatus Portnoybacteria bacterium CG09_land_8_20_14_0_10_44_13]|uniref:Cell filamentation protein Fic n=3 Tax=Candidatus Portnoyibacteriota TaxID=1817913 RepID=A0A2H0KP80_9BACT|nr:MAG: cell filamentation protein Fic [Parcubacteria group bacterium CG2_30_44_18]PIQ73960.1 MAG: cell filamentation protein Fic [Candidatus Portnoybacteria bacterium CG11_big_fil_rev_8_21_14_0_20_44_10]PIS17154.1 MAG: cell filamentation protein Fic [Candidatus Portnoybacteria bacterium CG09_land_8_20_14_0_10_44_13]PJA63070.1 MAG: cell filamentation protein Fic [Candidatus Portnoybacteria bacterium CG_4_9_14_3_um_filter_44_9]